jgi:predicted transcriptional regulator
MNSTAQKETLQALVNLYQNSENGAVKGKILAKLLNRNPGTIRNQMSILTTLGYVNGVSGPHGGYKPTIKAYEMLDISISENLVNVPIFRENEKIEDVSAMNIDFTSVAHPNECKSTIKILGNMENINLSDKIRVGPTPTNNMEFRGTVIGRDDIDNVLLLNIDEIKSIPKKRPISIKRTNMVKLNPEDTIKDAVKKFYANKVEEGPVLDKTEKIIGLISLKSILKAIATEKEDGLIKDIMNRTFIKANDQIKLKLAMNIMRKNNYQPLVIVDADEKVKRIINSKDIIEELIGI